MGKFWVHEIKFIYLKAPCTNVPITIPGWSFTLSGHGDHVPHASNTIDFDDFNNQSNAKVVKKHTHTGTKAWKSPLHEYDIDAKIAKTAWAKCRIKYACKADTATA